MMACCSKLICDGCRYANSIRKMEQKIENKCPFCRHPIPKSKEEATGNRMKRVEANDPVALREEGKTCYYEDGDFRSAFEYCQRELSWAILQHIMNCQLCIGGGDRC